MRRASNTSVMLGSVGAAGVLLLVGAMGAGAWLRAPVAGLASAAASPPHVEAPSATTPEAGAETSAAVEAPSAAAPQLAAALTSSSEALSPQLLQLAAGKAPFDPERQAPTGRYLFPEERIPPAPPPEPQPPPTPPFRVVGAIASANGGVAVLHPEGQAPKVLSVGEQIMGYRVSSVEDDVVVVSSQGWDLSLPVEQLQPVRGGSGSRNRPGERTNDRNSREQERELERATERAMEQMRERLEQLQQRFQGSGQGQVQWEFQGDRAIITGPNGARQEIRFPGGEGQVDRVFVVPGQRYQVRPGGGR